MNDSELRYIANQVAASNRQLIIDEIDRRFRMPTGVDSGGPFSSFSVNDQGQLIAASSVHLVHAHFSSDATLGAGATLHVNYDTVDYDPLGCIATGVGTWIFTAPLTKYYRFEPLFTLTNNGNVFDKGDFWASYLYKNASFVSFIDQANFFVDASSSVPFVVLGNARNMLMNAGDTAHIRLENNSTHSHKTSFSNGGNTLDIFSF